MKLSPLFAEMDYILSVVLFVPSNDIVESVVNVHKQTAVVAKLARVLTHSHL